MSDGLSLGGGVALNYRKARNNFFIVLKENIFFLEELIINSHISLAVYVARSEALTIENQKHSQMGAYVLNHY